MLMNTLLHHFLLDASDASAIQSKVDTNINGKIEVTAAMLEPYLTDDFVEDAGPFGKNEPGPQGMAIWLNGVAGGFDYMRHVGSQMVRPCRNQVASTLDHVLVLLLLVSDLLHIMPYTECAHKHHDTEQSHTHARRTHARTHRLLI